MVVVETLNSMHSMYSSSRGTRVRMHAGRAGVNTRTTKKPVVHRRLRREAVRGAASVEKNGRRRRCTRGGRRCGGVCVLALGESGDGVMSVGDSVVGGVSPNIVLTTGTAFQAGVEVIYLMLLVFVVGGIGYVGLQQLLIRRRLDLASKDLQEKVRTGEATAEELYQYGAIMIEREYYSLAIKTLKQSVEKWEGKDVEEAQIHNALGFALQKMDKVRRICARVFMHVTSLSYCERVYVSECGCMCMCEYSLILSVLLSALADDGCPGWT